MDLEELAVNGRAAALANPAAWRRPDPDEADEPRLCEVPGCENPVRPSAGPNPTHVCVDCFNAGLIPKPCLSCGGPLRRRDQTIKEKEWRNICQKCRVEANAEFIFEEGW
jgi:hypothetical protein